MKTLDSLNQKMGRGIVFYAGSGIKREWAATASRRSPDYTTDWNQLMLVFA
jgi:DNA polymerase V